MTKVALRPKSATTKSAASSSDGALTPRSDTGSIAFSSGTGNESLELGGVSLDDISSGPSADTPIPSIEGTSGGDSNPEYATTRAGHSRTPSISLTPPPASTPPTSRSAKGKGVSRTGQRSDSIDARLENMRISSPDSGLGMSEVAAAIDGIASGSDTSLAGLQPESFETRKSPSLSRTRRRSSSRTVAAQHDVKDEDPPHDRFHEPAFRTIFSDAKGQMSNLKNVLESSSIHANPDSTMKRLHKSAEDLAGFQCPSSRIVGFVGDTGVGKSSLINSLLDYEELARASNSGAACTCVATEYHYHDSDNFIIDVELFSMDDIVEQIDELLESYRLFHLRSSEMTDEDEKRDSKEGARVAQDTLRALFRGRLTDECFLTDRPANDVLCTLKSWTRETRPSRVAGQQVKSTLAECSHLLMQLTSEHTSSEGPAYWPYIRKIKVFLKAHILSKGLILVDLPGLRDLNSARQNVTERYLRQCDGIFAVCNIGRATTDAGVMSVFELARRARLSNVGIVCTRSDDIQAEEAKKDWKGPRATTIQRLIDRKASDEQSLIEIEIYLADMFNDIEYDELTEDEKQDEREHRRRADNTRTRIKQTAFQLKQYLVQTRNEIISTKLLEDYNEKSPEIDVTVFCVSNTAYWDHRNSPRDEALRYLQLSGILKLRKHCMSMVSNSQLSLALKYMQDKIPAFLNELELWVESGAGTASAEQKQAVRETLNTIEARLQRDLSGRSSTLNSIEQAFNRAFNEHFGGRSTRAWTQGAIVAGRAWCEWNWGTYAAFARKYGDYCLDKAGGSRNWNEEAMKTMTLELTEPWDDLCLELQEKYYNDLRSIEAIISWATEYLDNEFEGSSASPTILVQALESRQRLLIADVEQIWAGFETGLDELRIDTFSGIRTSFFGKAMDSSYRAANMEKGGGSHERRKAHINGILQQPALFKTLIRQFTEKFKSMTENLQTEIKAAVTDHLDVIHGTLDIVRSENVALESEQDPEFRSRVQAAVQTAQRDMAQIQSAIVS